MSIETTPGQLPGEAAHDPASAVGCCASAVASPAAAGPVPAAACCGTAEAAREAGTCCAPQARTAAVAAGAGCCG